LERTSLARTLEWRNVDTKTLREEIIPRDRPAVLKGLVRHWPILRAAAESPQALSDYIRARDLGRPLRVLVGRPEIKGFLFYRDDLRGLNFELATQPFHAVLTRILACIHDPAPPALYTGAASVEKNFKEIGRENTLEVLDRQASSWLWLGNAVTMPTHYDPLDGINCIIAGRKRFTFFPPDQLPNLYVGPLEHAPGGQPTSLVRLAAPDLERFPRFARALATAEVAEVEPGDAVFLPNLWWHNVESLEPLNLSMNYWWFDAAEWEAEPFAALAFGLLALTPLPASRREAWRAMFDHYVFQTGGDPIPYVPADHRGMLGRMTPALAHQMRILLIRSLVKKMPQEAAEQILRILWAAR
jgi:hypothetical protein